MMRSIFTLPFFFLLFAFSDMSQADIFAEQCPYGIKAKTLASPHLDTIDECLQNQHIYSQGGTLNGQCEVSRIFAGRTHYGFRYVKPEDCRSIPFDDTYTSGCSPNEVDPITGYCSSQYELLHCEGSSGSTYMLLSASGGFNRDCEGYCEGPRIDPQTGEPVSSGLAHLCDMNSVGQPLTLYVPDEEDPYDPTDPTTWDQTECTDAYPNQNCEPAPDQGGSCYWVGKDGITILRCFGDTDTGGGSPGGDTGGGDTGGGDTGGGDTGGGDTGGGDTGGGDTGGGDTGGGDTGGGDTGGGDTGGGDTGGGDTGGGDTGGGDTGGGDTGGGDTGGGDTGGGIPGGDTGGGTCDPSESDYLQCLQKTSLPGAITDVGTFAGSAQAFFDRVSNAPLVRMGDDFAGIFDVQGADCPSFSIDLPWPINQTVSTTLHCQLMNQISGIISALMLIIYAFYGIRIIMSA